jgi:polysaccharide biosynthesis protein PelF
MNNTHKSISQKLPDDVKRHADVCLVLEGTYPYVRGGVSSWTHDMIRTQRDTSFHIICLLPGTEAPKVLFEVPDNVVSVSNVFLGQFDRKYGKPIGNLMQKMQPILSKILHNQADKADFHNLIQILKPVQNRVGGDYLLNSEDTWNALVEMYESRYRESSMLDYFWSWRALLGSVFSILFAPLPEADIYHTICTGYAGLLAARASIEKDRPAIVTEHGIYTNERRIEIASADWLEQTASSQLTIDELRPDLRDLWIDAFSNYSKICYECSDKIITLYQGNQTAQLSDGATPEKMHVIPNGIDVARFGAIERKAHDVPTIAMIGRVVPIKDVKSFIRACAMIRTALGDVKIYVMGNIDEDPDYYEECRQIATHAGLDGSLEFTGAVKIDDYLPEIDVIIFTSISEAQPLVILEVGAAGIPVVATSVGACEEMIYGADNESPRLGAGGAVVPLANPSATAQATIRLLTDPAYYQECAYAMKQRVQRYYTQSQQQLAYSELYSSLSKG